MASGKAGERRMGDVNGAGGEGSGRYDLTDWDDAGRALLTATAADPDAALAAALTGILAAASGGTLVARRPEEATSAAAIRGQGRDFPAVLTELAADLLAQVDANGTGLSHVRLDGVLETDDGYTAWGYALGIPNGNGATVNVELVDSPTVEQTPGTTVVRCTLRRF